MGESVGDDLAGPAGLGAKFRQWIDDVGPGVFTSTVIHAVILLLMSLLVLPEILSEEPAVVTVVQGEDDAAFQDITDVRVDLSETEAAADSTPTTLLPTAVPIPVTPPSSLIANGTGKGSDSADKPTSTFGPGGFRLLAPDNAVKQGRFTAWTIPIGGTKEESRPGQPPRPRQPYHIVIQIKLPDHYRTYPVADLEGMVVGTDDYVLRLPKNAFYYDKGGELVPVRGKKRITVVNHAVQILIYVPGAAELVRDTIRVGSRRLKEKQTLELVFQNTEEEDQG